jgi:hypothetical protein
MIIKRKRVIHLATIIKNGNHTMMIELLAMIKKVHLYFGDQNLLCYMDMTE